VKDALKGFGIFALVVAIIGGITFGGWEMGWWFKNQNTTRTAQMYDHSYGRQEALKAGVQQGIVAVLTNDRTIVSLDPKADAALVAVTKAQTVGILNDNVCKNAALIDPANPLTGQTAEFVAANCYAGAMNPNSAYAAS
jgi:hypothetical protein